MDHVFIKSFDENEQVTGVYFVSESSLLKNKNGKLYISATLKDKSGEIAAKIWDATNALKDRINQGEFVKIRGQINVFRESKQVIISNFVQVNPETLDMKNYLPCSKRDPSDMFIELTEVIKSIKNKYIKKLLENTFSDEKIKDKFINCPAAKSIHHAYIGGLIEHVLSLCKLSDKVCEVYSFLNRDVLIFGSIYHDIGKIWELSFKTHFQYTDSGRLLGHIMLASELLDNKVSEIDGFPYKLKIILKHMVISHHGKFEFGSPKRPKFLEAFVFHYLDDLDSKVFSISNLISECSSEGKSWTNYSTMYDRYFYTQTFDSDLE